MTPTDQTVLSMLRAGLTRTQIAERRGVTIQSVSQTCDRLRKQGHILPAPQTRPATARAKADPFWAAGYSPRRVADLLGISHPRACNLRKEWLNRGDPYKGLVIGGKVIDRIMREVAERHGTTVAVLVGPARDAASCRVRFEAMWLAYQERRPDGSRLYSQPQIAARFGGRDHTTVTNAIRRYEAILAAEKVAA